MVVVWLCWVGYASAATPTLVQHVSSSANPVGVASAGNVFKFALPNAVQAGNCLILGLTYAWSSNRTVSIGDTNGNVWPASAAVTASSGSGTISAVYVLPNAQAGVTTITITANTVDYCALSN